MHQSWRRFMAATGRLPEWVDFLVIGLTVLVTVLVTTNPVTPDFVTWLVVGLAFAFFGLRSLAPKDE